ncbi:Anthocyanidin 3-O-glucosyltransferase 2 [Acorus gramineus]|uniref:Glycosyltransferase n=1 Tax=Acorus gramineus TaxID=55184 RepID=A0AAV9AXG2_ACOGR|nr:Anthocyanidin 3-O-glucosyltransferase 2 [Acorus gramineus]
MVATEANQTQAINPSTTHVAVLAFPFGTHASPLLSLTCLLASSAPHVTFSFFTTSRSNASLSASKTVLPNLTLYDVSDGAPDDYVPSPIDPEEEVELFMKVTPDNFRSAMASAIISDSFLSFAGDLAADVGAVWVSLWTGGPCSLSSHVYTDLLRDRVVPARCDEEMTLGFVPGLSGLRVRDLPEGVVSGRLDSVFARLLHTMGQEIHRADLVVLNTFDGLNPAVLSDLKTKFRQCLPLGPINLLAPLPPEPDRESCLSWLERHEPRTVVFISFGTIMTPPAHELAFLARGLESARVPFLWSMRDAGRAKLPHGFLERVKGRGLVVGWAPQRAVLAHRAVAVFVTHCGWNSVLESLAGGVPMIGRPFIGDQRINARVVSHEWGIGVGFDAGFVSEKAVKAALEVMVRSPVGEEMREMARARAEDAACAVDGGGSSRANFERLLGLICERGHVKVGGGQKVL